MRRGVGAFLAVGVLLPLVVAANASAQGATLVLNPATARPGQAVTVTGSGFSSGAGTSAVNIRLSTRTGQSLASTSADTRGRISASVPIPPSLGPGTYLIVGTQTIASGRQGFATPGRAVLQVVAAGQASNAAPPRGGSSDGGPPAPLPAVAIALALLAGGCVLTVRRLRTVNRSLGS